MTDDYTQAAKAQSENKTPQEKAEILLKIIKSTNTLMFTTINPSGQLHSRAMAPASNEGLCFSFFANSEQGKFAEIAADAHVNLSCFDPKTTSWVSISGKAKKSEDRERIKKLFSTSVQAWFGKKDEQHKGDENDPRVVLIDVEPFEISIWEGSSGISRLTEVAVAAVSSKVATPGQMFNLNKTEIEQLALTHKCCK